MLRIRAMTFADIPFGMRLKDQAGWNQVDDDWRRMLGLQPDGCFVAEKGGIAAGTVTFCRFGRVAWVAMMLVDQSFRGRGIGRALMSHALGELDSAGVHSIRLDATPLGRPLYDSLDFAAESKLARYLGVIPPADEPPGLNETPASDVLDAVAALDREVTGTDRGRLLRSLVEEQPESLHVTIDAGKVSGFVLARRGSRARRIGPCVADGRAGPRLLGECQRRYAGEIVTMDIPTENAPAVALAASWGLGVTGELTRMGRGPRVTEDLARLWSSSGPEKG